SLSRIHEIANLPPEKDGKANGEGQLEKSDPRGRIEFRDVSLRYGEELPQVVKNVSFTVDSGKKIAICGRSGSGKSSLILALFRAIDPSLISGKILLDDIDTQTISLRKLRNSFSLVFQTPFIWQAPLRHNLDPRHIHTDKDIWLALERVGMSEAVSALTDKLESVLEDGGSLSSGQRQLLCLARVLLRRGDVIVLDEASSSLDTETDAKIRDVVRTDLRSATVLTVAHRIETIVEYDTVLVLDGGKVVELGAPAELLARGGRFAALAQSQGVVG
ncbi:P-loop containing nucleoside triphosphate hydrolase protein, partial [Mycena amicta]